MSRVVAVIGGGISGLGAARVLASGQKEGGEGGEGRNGAASRGGRKNLEIVVLEADDRFGGKILSGLFRGRPIDFGPDNFLTRNPRLAELCDILALSEDLIAPATSSASVLARGPPAPNAERSHPRTAARSRRTGPLSHRERPRSGPCRLRFSATRHSDHGLELGTRVRPRTGARGAGLARRDRSGPPEQSFGAGSAERSSIVLSTRCSAASMPVASTSSRFGSWPPKSPKLWWTKKCDPSTTPAGSAKP